MVLYLLDCSQMSTDPNEYHLVVFDPGGTTGWAHLTIDRRAFSRPEHKVLGKYLKDWSCGEFSGSENEQIAEASRLIWSARFGKMPYNSTTDVLSSGLSLADIVSEDFELTQMVGGKSLLSPVRVNAKLEWECYRWGLTLQYQRRTLRTNVTPARLFEFGFTSPFRGNGQWSTSGKGKDAFAAMQHAIVWVRRRKEASKGRPWKIYEGGSSFYDCACADNIHYKCDLRHPGGIR